MEEIFRIADRYTVLRNGATVGEGPITDVTSDDLVALMVQGATAQSVVQRSRSVATGQDAQPIALEVNDLRTDGVHGVSMQLRAGELLGLGGQGQQQVLRAIFGDIPYTGQVLVAGKPARFTHQRQAMQRGVTLVPGARARRAAADPLHPGESFDSVVARLRATAADGTGATGCRCGGGATQC